MSFGGTSSCVWKGVAPGLPSGAGYREREGITGTAQPMCTSKACPRWATWLTNLRSSAK